MPNIHLPRQILSADTTETTKVNGMTARFKEDSEWLAVCGWVVGDEDVKEPQKARVRSLPFSNGIPFLDLPAREFTLELRHQCMPLLCR